jgi:hypothetical protein
LFCSINEAESKRRAVADKNSATMIALQKKLHAGGDTASILTQDRRSFHFCASRHLEEGLCLSHALVH